MPIAIAARKIQRGARAAFLIIERNTSGREGAIQPHPRICEQGQPDFDDTLRAPPPLNGKGQQMVIPRSAVLLVLAVGSTGCSLATLARQNVDAINSSSAVIGENTKAIRASTEAQGTLIPALQGVERLRGPMESVADLQPALGAVAGLNEPMGRVAALDGSMRSLAELRGPMTNLGGIGRSLDAAAALDGPMTRVAAMRSSLDAVAGLQGSLDMMARLEPHLASVADLQPAMTQLGELHDPLQRVAALEAPMSRLAGLTGLFDRPLLLAFIALIALAAWGLVTFVAVRYAIVSAGRVTEPARVR
jgi:hypothetical protein